MAEPPPLTRDLWIFGFRPALLVHGVYLEPPLQGNPPLPGTLGVLVKKVVICVCGGVHGITEDPPLLLRSYYKRVYPMASSRPDKEGTL